MAKMRYQIVFQGELLPGVDHATAIKNLMEIVGFSAEKAKKILRSRVVIFKKNDLDEASARKYAATFKKVGLKVAIHKKNKEGAAEPMPSQQATREQKPETNIDEDPRAFSVPPVEKALQPPPDTQNQLVYKIPFEFHGSGGEYFRIWVVNILLSIVTLGIYSAWAKVRRKQYFYGNTRIQGASFVYLADPVKILKGRLIVAVFIGANAVLSSQWPIASTVLSLVFLAVFPWLVVRSLAFTAQNSSVRNLRFSFKGTFWEAAKVYILWPFLSLFTLGILFPYVYFRQKKFVVENTRYGKTLFTFKAGPREYYRMFFFASLSLITCVAVIVGLSFLNPRLVFFAGPLLYLFMFAYYSVKTTNLLFNGISLSTHGFESDLMTKEYFWLVFTNTLGVVCTLGLFNPWAKVRTFRYKLEHLKLLAAGDLDSFVASEQEQVGALGDEMSDFFDFDFGL
jgi:uncharacterized membrane protein YjgN (DUF898 family)